ncbi:UDP-N-acetylmuramate--L-alanine ligase [Candidatus Falkowbacteria bacterium]|nr:UDP-N-acetylmuramate--L-alanine ligase [Candidatus Falkowbacteria bacterium]
MDLTNVKKVFICGIGGIGTSAMAKFFLSRGLDVVGSDLVKTEITEELERRGVKIYYEHKESNVTYAVDLFVYSAAVAFDNPEMKKAKEQHIPLKSYYEIIGELSRDYNTIAVSGTNGKSTTTAMIASILIDAGKDPTVIVGSRFEKLDANFRDGQSDLFVVESCEYRAHMLLLRPRTIVLTNIEADHLDFYKDLNHIVQTFQQYVGGLKSENDLLVYNNDDLNIRKLNLPKCRMARFGFVPGADALAENVRKLPGKQIFDVVYYGQNIGEFELKIPGDINIYNALAASAYCLTLNIPIGVIKQCLKEFKGIWRRFEIIKNEEIAVISDYAHHPTAVSATIKATREFMPGRRVVAVFQPHQRARTKKLFNEFVKSFDLVDVVVLPEIYDVAGREETGQQISSKDLAAALKTENPKKEIVYAQDLAEAVDKVKLLIKPEDIVLVMGAGDVYKIVNEI